MISNVSCRMRSRSRRVPWQSLPWLDEDVCGEGGESRGDLPDVQVVHVDHSGLGGQCPADVVDVDAFGCCFEEDASAGPEQPVGGAEHQRGDEQRRDRVGPVKAGREDDDGGDGGSDERVEVGQDVLEAALDVEAPAVGPRQCPGGGEVDGDADQRDRQDQPRRRRWAARSGARIASNTISAARTSSVTPLAWAERISARR